MADEIAWRRNWKPDFQTQPWNVINTTDSTYLIKFYFEETHCSYKIAITDYEKIWFEEVDQSTFEERAKKLNPKVEAQNSYLLNHLLGSLVQTSSTDTFSVKESEFQKQNSGLLTLSLKFKLKAGVPFFWEFYFSLGEKQLMKDQFVLPLLSMVAELQRRQTELVKMLQKKDYEIQEYKNSGAVLSRKAFETPKFDQDTFSKKMTVSEGFLEIVDNCVENSCNKENQELYEQIMIKNQWLEFKKNHVSTSDDDETLGTEDSFIPSTSISENERPVTSSWDTKLPPSLFDDMDSLPVKRSPKKSPKKMSSPEKSPSKGEELRRREVLRKKLAEDKEKSKSRKKMKLKY